MQKIKYSIKKIFKMNFKGFFETIDIVHTKNKKSKIFIFFDLIYCYLKYGSGHLDYRNFGMYDMDRFNRAKILTLGKNNDLIRKLNDKNYFDIFDNKVKFNQTFKEHINREYLMINDNYNEFLKFIKNKEYIMIKPIDGLCGKGIEKIKVSEHNPQELYNYLIETRRFLIEEVAIQHEAINKLFAGSINTIRIVTVINDAGITSIVGSYIRMGVDDHVVDNFNSGGIACTIDPVTGKINRKAINKLGQTFEEHPNTKVKLIDYQIPYWDKIIDYVNTVSKIVPQIRYVGWDICVGPNKPFLIEANSYPGQDLCQIPSENVGTYNVIVDALKKK